MLHCLLLLLQPKPAHLQPQLPRQLHPMLKLRQQLPPLPQILHLVAVQQQVSHLLHQGQDQTRPAAVVAPAVLPQVQQTRQHLTQQVLVPLRHSQSPAQQRPVLYC